MLVNYFCGVADKLKSLARQAQSAGSASSKRWLDRLKSLARQAQITSSSELETRSFLSPSTSTPSPQYAAAGR